MSIQTETDAGLVATASITASKVTPAAADVKVSGAPALSQHVTTNEAARAWFAGLPPQRQQALRAFAPWRP